MIKYLKENVFPELFYVALFVSIVLNVALVLKPSEPLEPLEIKEVKTYWQGKFECVDSLKEAQGELKAYKAIFSKIELGTLQFMYEENGTKKPEEVSWR